MVALVFWTACMHNGCAYCHLHVCENFTNHERCHAQWKNEIMNGNQGDHVTFVGTWRRSKQRLSFCCTFYKSIQHHDADAVHLRTLRSPVATLLTKGVAVSCQTLNFRSQSNYVFKMSHIDACLQNVQHILSPSTVEASQFWVSSASRQKWPSMLFKFTK